MSLLTFGPLPRRAIFLGAAVLSSAVLFAVENSVSRAAETESSLQSINGGGLRSINGGGLRSINGGGLRSINGGGLRSINGGGLRSINGGGLRSINGGGLRSINGGGLRSINGGGLRSINGGGLRSINGGGLRSINGGGLRSINGGGLRSISGGGLRSGGVGGTVAGAEAGTWTSAFDSAAMGPIEDIQTADDGSVAVTILGQRFATTPNTISENSLNVGDYVVAAGDAKGSLLVLYALGDQYIPGSSPVSVVGQIGNADSSVGTLSIGGATVDYSAHLALDPTYVPESGQLIEVRGLQPLPGGVVVIGSNATAGDVSTLRALDRL